MKHFTHIFFLLSFLFGQLQAQQKPAAYSASVVLASDQPAISVDTGTSSQLPPALLNGGLAVTGTSPSISGTAGALNANVELTVSGAAGAAINVAGTWVGTLTFQSTIDGTTWLTHNGTVYGGASVTNVSTTAANGAWAFRVAGAQKIRAIFTAYTSGTATIDIRAATSVGGTASEGLATQPVSGTVTIGTSVTPGTAATNLGKAEDAVAASGDVGVAVLGVRRDVLTTSASAAADYSEVTVNRFGAAYTAGFRTSARTYSATGNVTVAATATDIAAIFGNATTAVAVTKIRLTGIQTTTGTVDVLAIVRSTANSGGTSSGMSVTKHEQADGANNSTPITYTANPTPGTSAGIMRRFYLPVSAAASGLSADYTCEFGDNGKPIILSGTAQGLVINLNGITVTGGVFNVVIEWYEF
ncbi:hypothetical protein UFOVP1090_32 [uncultured Caudovirales phage]|uniref:Uncharacterized protein n=1 Tax=uncultured Caudovirales phage TaxID=2100421 RepID=A0A6J5QGS3_9CAUD|nr:hypothetical protein UFOVP1090_32 [uncultured Caudovirales phage]